MKYLNIRFCFGIVLAVFAVSTFPGCMMDSGHHKQVFTANTSRIVALGDSMTMGTIDGGVRSDFQAHTYAALVSEQMGEAGAYQQPTISIPGIGVPPFSIPLAIDADGIDPTLLAPDLNPLEFQFSILGKLTNISLRRPYNNLGVNGARLADLRSVYTTEDSSGGTNFFFDLVLRNTQVLNFFYFEQPRTIVEQAALLNPAPDYVFLWIGNNDVLAFILSGGNDDGASPITESTTFRIEYEELLRDLLEITPNILVANLPGTLIDGYLPYVTTLDSARDEEGKFYIFDRSDFSRYNFGTDQEPLYIELACAETDAKYLTLSGALEVLTSGAGIPDATGLAALSLDEEQVIAVTGQISTLVTGQEKLGIPIGGEYTLSESDLTAAIDALQDFNTTIGELVAKVNDDVDGAKIRLVDVNALLSADSLAASGYSALHPLRDPDRSGTVFSLDGVHASYLGHALVANEFIHVLKEQYGETLDYLDPAGYTGQYQ